MLDKHRDSQKSTTESHDVDRSIEIHVHDADLRHAITERINVEEDVTVGLVVADVAREFDVPAEDVIEEVNRLEEHGFLYRVGDGGDAEVRLP
jgi:predicted transcriptional regulator of viral defense system